MVDCYHFLDAFAVTHNELEIVSRLFNEYRIFYKQKDDYLKARDFLKENLDQNRSQIFLLFDENNQAVAFSQLYPALSSVSMQSYYYLSDLYVDQSARQKGYAKQLMNFLTNHFASEGIERLTLDTAFTNKIAQHLYESLGYERETVYITYHQMLNNEI